MARKRWVRRGIGGAAALLFGVGVVFAYVLQQPSAFTVDDALADFRSASTGATAGDTAGEAATAGEVVPAGPGEAAEDVSRVAGAPETHAGDPVVTAAPSGGSEVAAEGARRISPGVYTYRTDGYEATDALNGSRHDYPAETPITVQHNDCGFVQRWQPLEGRWDESDFCVDEAGVSIRRFTTRHEFFKQRQTDEYLCPAGTYVYRDGVDPGAAWSWTCESSNSTFATTVTFVGMAEVSVGDETVAAHHYRYDSTMAGATRGTQVQERWVDPATGLLLKMTTDIDSEADSPFGTVRYEEHYVLTLTGLDPHR